LFNSKLNDGKLGFNTPLRTTSLNTEFIGSYKKVYSVTLWVASHHWFVELAMSRFQWWI